MTLGTSKPCAQCIRSLQLYNVMRVCYSDGADAFVWEDVDTMTNAYRLITDPCPPVTAV